MHAQIILSVGRSCSLTLLLYSLIYRQIDRPPLEFKFGCRYKVSRVQPTYYRFQLRGIHLFGDIFQTADRIRTIFWHNQFQTTAQFFVMHIHHEKNKFGVLAIDSLCYVRFRSRSDDAAPVQRLRQPASADRLICDPSTSLTFLAQPEAGLQTRGAAQRATSYFLALRAKGKCLKF